MPKKNYLQKQNLIYLFTIIISLILLYQNRMWASFPDESDNFVGGWLISKGFVLYKDMFSHHMPFQYYYASLLIELGLSDINGLRIGMMLTILFFWILMISVFRKKIDQIIICIPIFLYAIAHPIFFGHTLFADNFLAFSILIIFLYFLSKPDLNFNYYDKIVIVLMIFISIMSTQVGVYVILLFAGYYVIKKLSAFYIGNNNFKIKPIEEIKFILMIAIPFIAVLISFYLNKSLLDFIDQAFFFNKIYYSQFVKEHMDYYGTLKYMWYPLFTPWFFETSLILSNIILIFMLYKKKYISFSFFYLILIIVLRIRGGFLHGAPYYLLSFFGIGFIISHKYELIKIKIRSFHQSSAKIDLEIVFISVYCLLLIILLIVTSHAYFSNGSGRGEKTAYISPYDSIIQKLTEPDDMIWVGPLEPSLYFTNNRLPASRYTFYLPWQAASDTINKELLEDLRVNKPPIIIFHRDAIIWDKYITKNYGKIVDDFIQSNYYRVDKEDPIFNKVYLINTKKDELLRKLSDSGLYQH